MRPQPLVDPERDGIADDSRRFGLSVSPTTHEAGLIPGNRGDWVSRLMPDLSDSTPPRTGRRPRIDPERKGHDRRGPWTAYFM